MQSSSNKRNSTASSDSFEEDDEVYEDDADGVALLDMVRHIHFYFVVKVLQVNYVHIYKYELR